VKRERLKMHSRIGSGNSKIGIGFAPLRAEEPSIWMEAADAIRMRTLTGEGRA
jgi:hypothetical protein